jgi:hypothetical protein
MRTTVFRYASKLALIVIGATAPAFGHGILLGVNPHLMSNPTAQRVRLQLAREIGFDAVRDDALWSEVETRKSVYTIPSAWDAYVNDARRNGIQPLIILDYGNRLYDASGKPKSSEAIAGFVRYASFVVRHFKGRVKYFEIWNEWDTHAGGAPSGSATDYARLFNAVFPVLKTIDPSGIFLVSASAAGNDRWYTRVAQLGIASHADGVAVHPYVYPDRSSTSKSTDQNEAELSAQDVINIEATMRRVSGATNIPLYITEIGWPTSHDASGVTNREAATLAQRAFLLFCSLPYVRGVWWYDLVDDGPDGANSQDRFGILRQDLSFKPVALAIQSIAGMLKKNHMVLSEDSSLRDGLVVIRGSAQRRSSLIAWDIRHARTPNGRRETTGYAVTCGRALNVQRTASSDFSPGFQITATPTLFSYSRSGCTRKKIGVVN